MKIRSSIIWFCVIVIILGALIIWLGKKKPAETPTTALVDTNVIPQATIVSSPLVNALIHTNALVTKPPTTTTTPLSKEERAIGLLSTYNDQPIDFYGQIEDQLSNAVAGAAVGFSVTIINGYESTVKRGQVISDANGFFTILGYKGQDLSIVPQKAGYILAETSTLFKYSHLEDHPYVSDPNNPTVIKMWKLQGSEPLLGINQRYKFNYTDAPIKFDLLKGQIVPNGGDIKITVSRSPGLISGRTRQDWGVQVEAIDGGLIEPGGQEGVTFEAPEDGYLPSDYFVMSTNAPHKWFGGFDQTFFLKSRKGQVYSKVNFGITINQQPNDYVWVEFHGVANTNSSRNWEATAPQ
jgi:hypothetical protein